jgi:hypothetical protein
MIRRILCKIGIHTYPRHAGISPPGHRYPRFGACICGKIHPENVDRYRDSRYWVTPRTTGSGDKPPPPRR